jgi:hypothetical protein
MTTKFVLFAYTLPDIPTPEVRSQYRLFGIFDTEDAAVDFLRDHLIDEGVDEDFIDLILTDLNNIGNSQAGEIVYAIGPAQDYSTKLLIPFGPPGGSGRSRRGH